MNLLRFFPVPTYLRIKSAGLDISDRSIKYTELKQIRGGFGLKKFGEKKIEDGIIESGIIKDRKKFIEHLKVLRREIKNNYVVVSLPEEKAFLKMVRMPPLQREQIKKSLELQLEEIIPLPSSETAFDCEIVRELPQSKGLEVILIAFPKKLTAEYAECLKEAGFTPVVFEVESQAEARALVSFDEKKTVMIMDFGRTRTGLLVCEGGIVKFTSTLPIAGESLTKALSQNLKIDISEAEHIKRTQFINKKTNERILSAIMPAVSAIKDEVRRVFDYWHAHNVEEDMAHNDIEKIILCGGDSNLYGFIEYLSFELKCPVELGNPWLNINSLETYVPEMERKKALAYVTSLGLSLAAFKDN